MESDLNIPKKHESFIINVENNKIKIPLFISMGSYMEYSRSYDETKDYKMAFISMLLKMMAFDKVNKDIDISKIKSIDDQLLLKVMEKIINSEKLLHEYFNIENCKITYENFYKAYQYQNKKMTEGLSEALKPIISSLSELGKTISESYSKGYKDIIKNISPSLNTINLRTQKTISPKINIPYIENNEYDKLLEPILSDTNINYISKYNITPEVLEFSTQEDIYKEIVESNKNIKELCDCTNQIFKYIEKSNKNNKRNSIIALVFSFLGIVISILSFLERDFVFSLFK